MTLKEKLMENLLDLSISTYVKYIYSFALRAYTPRFPPLPTIDMALAFSPSFLQWFICMEFLKIHKNKCL